MPLTPPPDYTKVVASAVLGITLALVVGLFTRSTLPRVGDSQHSLPHGGWYRDGTKLVHYNRPDKLNSVEGHKSSWNQPWAVVFLLSLLIIVAERLQRGACPRCGGRH